MAGDIFDIVRDEGKRKIHICTCIFLECIKDNHIPELLYKRDCMYVYNFFMFHMDFNIRKT